MWTAKQKRSALVTLKNNPEIKCTTSDTSLLKKCPNKALYRGKQRRAGATRGTAPFKEHCWLHKYFIFGHNHGDKSVRDLLFYCADLLERGEAELQGEFFPLRDHLLKLLWGGRGQTTETMETGEKLMNTRRGDENSILKGPERFEPATMRPRRVSDPPS